MFETLMMAGCTPEMLFRAKIMKWEQMAIHQDCMLARNSHQLWEDENLAKELQKKFDEEASGQTSSHDQVMESSDSEIEVISSSSQIIQIIPNKRHRVEISVVLRQSTRRRSQRFRDLSLDHETPRRRTQRAPDPFLDNEAPRRRAQRPRDPSMDNEVHRRRSLPPRDPSIDYEVPRRRAQPTRDPSLDYEDLHDIAERIGPAKRPGLRKAEIDMLPSRRVQPTKDPKGRSAAKTCDICLLKWKSGDSIKSLPCFHEFHAKCITDWLKINNSCPVCRLEVKFKNH